MVLPSCLEGLRRVSVEQQIYQAIAFNIQRSTFIGLPSDLKKTSFLFNVKMDFHHKVFMGSFYMNSVANCICENMQNTWYVAGCELSRFVAIMAYLSTL